ncbi:hypothetical protein [Nocardioides sp. BYT-33-1]|uniref:hypothetical protein n=1 Tax=Nocardioides sp. BYT-33-1 TaxID=3416952 RepID=UPI003F53E2A0
MTRTRREAIEHAALADIYLPAGMCARWTREQYGIGPSGDADGDGDVDAIDAWRRAVNHHPGDRNPPPGVPVFWSGGSKGHGHVAMSWPGGRIRGTDSPISGRIGTVDFDWIEKHWGLTYLGWAEGMSGVMIPVDAPKPPKPPTQLSKLRDKLRALKLKAKAKGKAKRKRKIRDALRELPKR